MKALDKAKIAMLKSTAKNLYISYHKMFERLDYDCGGTLAEYITPELYMIRKKFNETMDKLSALDPSAPKGRM